MESTATINQTAPAAPKVGRIRRGWQLTKSSWHVLKLDKELATLPLLSFLTSILVLIPFGLFALAHLHITGSLQAAGSTAVQSSSDFSATLDLAPWQSTAMGISIYLLMTFVANFFAGALIFGAAERFKGGDPTVRSSVAGARAKFRPLLLFSLMMATVGMILQALEERLPLAGAIATYLFDAAWNIANLFAIPVIVLSNENVGPITATKRSVGVIKKVWGESIVVNLGIGLIGFLSFLTYAFIGGLAGTGIAALVGPDVTGGGEIGLIIVAATIAFLGLITLILVFNTLGSIAKAALYHYATTGEAPESFDKQLLQASMTPKKARKVFGQA